MRIVVMFFALLALAASLCFAAGPQNLTSIQAKALLARNSRVLLLDVRTPEEYQQAHLRGALLVPVGDLGRRVQEVPRDRAVLVYCAVGSRSAHAVGLLSSKGYPEIYNMSDGLVGWYKNGFPVVRGSRP